MAPGHASLEQLPAALQTSQLSMASASQSRSAAPQPQVTDNAQAQLLHRSAQTPEMAARVIRAWMKES